MKKWILLIVLIIGAASAFNWMSKTPTSYEMKELAINPIRSAPPAGKATLAPGRVVELQMKSGKIEFVLFEKDCPKTTKRIADLVAAKAYDGRMFSRVEDWVVQTTDAKIVVPNMNIEVVNQLNNIVGAVGMARKTQYNTNISSFYILKKPAPHLNREYTVFAQVIRGMDVVRKLKANEVIKSAQLRASNEEDAVLLKKALSSTK